MSLLRHHLVFFLILAYKNMSLQSPKYFCCTFSQFVHFFGVVLRTEYSIPFHVQSHWGQSLGTMQSKASLAFLLQLLHMQTHVLYLFIHYCFLMHLVRQRERERERMMGCLGKSDGWRAQIEWKEIERGRKSKGEVMGKYKEKGNKDGVAYNRQQVSKSICSAMRS